MTDRDVFDGRPDRAPPSIHERVVRDAPDRDDGSEGSDEPVDCDPDPRRPSGVVSARAALLVSVGFALIAALALDGARIAAVGVAGAAVAGWGAGAVTAERKRRVAAGSAAVVLGSVVLFGGVALAVSAGARAYGALVLGTFVVAVAARDGFTSDATARFKRTVSESGFVCVVAFVAFSVAFLLFGVGLAGQVLAVLADASTATPFAAIVWLQAGVLAVALLFHRAARVVEEWSPGGDALGDGLAGRFGLAPADVPRWYVAVLVGQFVLASLAPDLVDPFVYARPLVARGIELLLLSGVAQGALAAVAGGLACVAIAPVARRSVVFWTGTSPGYTLAFAAGGAIAVVGSLLAGAIAAAGVAGQGLVPSASNGGIASAFGPAVPVVAATTGAFVGAAALVLGVWQFVRWIEPTGGGFAVGAIGILAGTVLLADALPALVHVLGAATALFVWDLGTHATGLERDLRGVVPSTRSEVVHATAAGGALLGGVVVAAGVGYLAVPLRVPEGRATVALALVVGSLVAFAYALRR